MTGTGLASHPRDIARFALERTRSDIGTALIFVTGVDGGGVRAPGLRMAVAADGATVGYVSNGCVEADLLTIAAGAIRSGRVTPVAYGQGSGKVDVALPCGGRMDILIVPVRAAQADALSNMLAEERTGGTLILRHDGELWWTTAATGPTSSAMLFPVRPKIRLSVIGAGQEAALLCRLGVAADMDVALLSPDAATIALVTPHAVEAALLRGLSSPAPLDADQFTAAAIMFHDHEWETRILGAALAGPAFYIGALGSYRAHQRRVEALRAAGHDDAAIDRISAPIGLVQRLRDPNLLALSILAEVTAAFQARYSSF